MLPMCGVVLLVDRNPLRMTPGRNPNSRDYSCRPIAHHLVYNILVKLTISPLLISYRVSRASSRWPIDVQCATTYLTILNIRKSKTKNVSMREDNFGVSPIITDHRSAVLTGPITSIKVGATLTSTLNETDEDQRRRTQQLVKT